MKRLVVFGATAGLLVTVLSLAGGATNLNSSRSNIYRLTYPTDLVKQDQVKALLEALDKLGPANEATLKKWLASNFRTHGIEPQRVKKIVILPPDKERKEIAVILLTNPADEAAAIAVTVKSSKSNSSD